MKQSSVLCFAMALTVVLPAQGLQLPTEFVDPSANWLSHTWAGGLYIPIGPVTLPATHQLFWASLRVARVGDTLSLVEFTSGSASGGSVAVGHVHANLVTRVVSPVPSRVTVECAATVAISAWPYLTTSSLVDVGANGSVEFTSGFPAAPNAIRSLLTDARGTPVRWAANLQVGALVGTFGGGVNSTLELRFATPVNEPTYGPACEGELGCQLVPNAPFARVLVGSLPSDTTYAWLLGGDQQQNLQFPGFPCPLLVDPIVILAVPLVDGANGRKFVDFDAVFPPLPGQVWFAQCIAVSGGTFVGTNGVRIQT